ncbi:F-box domain containing protein [Tanacetum coccineum]|uniref:F-box domain containing protein n=1 Tax=Tanacetum coccineum TaxID=301880 RepID=A0ABQ5I502_9ASTR
MSSPNLREVVRSVPLYYPSWEKVPKERKAAIISDIGTQFDLRPHMESPDWTADPTTGTYDVEGIRRARPEEITAAEWDKYIAFWNDPKNLARATQNRLNRQKSVVISRQGSRSLARLRDEMEEMRRLEATGQHTEDEINALARGGKLRGHIPGVGRVLPSRATSRPSMPATDKSLQNVNRKVDFMMSIFRSDSRYSDMFREFESGGASGSGGRGDDEEGGNDEDGEDEDDDGESFPSGDSPATCRWGNLSPATCRLGKGQNVAREDVECCSGGKEKHSVYDDSVNNISRSSDGVTNSLNVNHNLEPI